jgi:putative ABC transport system ATP-binding protein
MSILQVKNLVKVYNAKKKNAFKALHEISFEVEKGKSVAIVGKSGSGKSTLLHLLGAMDKPTDGEIIFGDQVYSSFSNQKLAALRGHEFGFVFQEFFLLPNLNVTENVLLPTVFSTKSKEYAKNVDAVLEKVGLADKKNAKVSELSGGQKQRVAVARSIINQPSIIFADEPTGALDTKTSDLLVEMLFDLNKKDGITLVIVTHDLDLAQKCDQIIKIQDGKIVE